MKEPYQVVRMFGEDFGVILVRDGGASQRLLCVAHSYGDAQMIADVLNEKEERDDF